MLRDCEGGPRMSDSGTWYITPAPICGMPLVRASPSQGGVGARICALAASSRCGTCSR